MYFFDFNDYISTARQSYQQWSGTTILSGVLGLGGWRGGFSADLGNEFGTANATYESWLKAISEYIVISLDILKEPTGSTISKLYYNELFDGHEDFFIKRRKYHNSLETSVRKYEVTQRLGTFVGTYSQWLDKRINIDEEVFTGNTSTYSQYSYIRPMVSGGTITKILNIDFGDVNNIQFRDSYYNDYKASLNNMLRIMKTSMVLIDGDTFPDLQ
jgi:hypothetical protein